MRIFHHLLSPRSWLSCRGNRVMDCATLIAQARSVGQALMACVHCRSLVETLAQFLEEREYDLLIFEKDVVLQRLDVCVVAAGWADNVELEERCLWGVRFHRLPEPSSIDGEQLLRRCTVARKWSRVY